MKSKTVFVCRECGNETPRWQGQCPACGAWNSIVEFEDKKAPARQNAVRGVARSTPKKLRDVTVGKHGLVGGRDGAREEGGRAEKRISGVADHFGDLLGLGTPSFFPRPLPR